MISYISEIQIIPVKPKAGIIAFASFVLNKDLFLGSIAVVTRPTGGFRLLYPTHKSGTKNFSIYHPINKKCAQEIENVIIKKFEEVMTHDRYSCYDPS
ncbi:hypothetical protein A3F57_03130 [Candidatus Roizmanbacteria bacterium RIFCSPHIGHO2_12_FULL_36_11]|uniref:SpoVG family protein n=1 Tax=Candidatus Curtissbacteria bacterium RIFCSPLOWO2_01_FULL_37_9 TaxID=1797724 RepID=A0A1F5GUE2_9BACT|nr:MAG: hypothetical protein A3A48_03625 [Candidatus Curtissbacteria bacterium RIFCSPLOWO2_01_FULL_37_9]OGK32556.1 MAG: hypothetical protein A3F57_03130 [Candidatus Roizmanbacteria bacterium RIFCSPHIGHO2_12_FULL_36_11]